MTSPAGLILIVIFLGPLVLLCGIGLALGRLKGAVIGGVFWLVGLFVFLYPSYREIEDSKLRSARGHDSYRDHCLHDAGSFYFLTPVTVSRAFVVADATIKERFKFRNIESNEALYKTEFVSKAPAVLAQNEVLIDIRSDFPVGEAPNILHVSGINTEVRDASGRVVARHINIDDPINRTPSNTCLGEPAERALERFLRQVIRFQPVLFSSIKSDQLLPLEYPIGTWEKINKSTISRNPAIHTLPLNSMLPKEWGCGAQQLGVFKCQSFEESPESLDVLESAKALFGVDDSWFALIDPQRVNPDAQNTISSLVLQQRDRSGRLMRTILVRSPPVNPESIFKLTGFNLTLGKMELTFATDSCIGWDSGIKYHYCEGFRLTFPLENHRPSISAH